MLHIHISYTCIQTNLNHADDPTPQHKFKPVPKSDRWEPSSIFNQYSSIFTQTKMVWLFVNPSVYDRRSEHMMSSFLIIWILLKWAFEVTNYCTVFWIYLLQWQSGRGPRGMVAVLVRSGGGRFGGGSEQPACNTWEAPCLHYQWHQTGKRKEGGSSCVRQLWELQCVETLTATLHKLTSHNHALSVTLILFFPLLHKTHPQISHVALNHLNPSY